MRGCGLPAGSSAAGLLFDQRRSYPAVLDCLAPLQIDQVLYFGWTLFGLCVGCL